MVALLSPSSPNLRRRRKPDPAIRSLPATLLTNRISELNQRLIDPASDVETVKAAKHSLLRLLSDPMTLPVITTPRCKCRSCRYRRPIHSHEKNSDTLVTTV